MKRKTITVWTSLFAGAMDSTTGLLLLLWPTLTLHLMGVGESYVDLVFVRFIGCFVFGVGSLYLAGIWSVYATGTWSELRTIWKATAWIRSVIFIFTLLAILQGGLAPQWAGVPAADGTLAAFQLYWILSGRFPGGR